MFVYLLLTIFHFSNGKFAIRNLRRDGEVLSPYLLSWFDLSESIAYNLKSFISFIILSVFSAVSDGSILA